MENLMKAYIAGGCFWGMEDLFRVREGIVDTEVGYLGGQNENPTYKDHPGHAEGIELTYNAEETTFEVILDYFYRIHNPTTIDRQGNDLGSSYRSTIFSQNEEEKSISEEIIKLVDMISHADWDNSTAIMSELALEKEKVIESYNQALAWADEQSQVT